MMTAGIAAARPTAVASSASAMPGATTARLVVCDFEMPMKLFMMPHTVPKSPTNGAVAPIVARTLMPQRTSRDSVLTISVSRDATRSLMLLSTNVSSDSRSSRSAASRKAPSTLVVRPRLACASARERDVQAAPRQEELDELGEEDRPGHERSKRQADHDAFDEGVGRQEHRPRRQLARHAAR